MHKRTAILAFSTGWIAGNFSLAFVASYRVLKAMQKDGYDVSSVSSLVAEIKKVSVCMNFYQELLTYVKDNNPEILNDPRFEQYAHDLEFIDMTKNF